jgi:hypothetical protein
MNRRQKPSARRKRVIRVWTLGKAQKALPLIASIVRSLREDRLEALAQQHRVDRLAARPGRPDRDALIAHEEAVRHANTAADRFESGLDELLRLNIYCLDPVRGLTLIPFAHDEQLAWFVFDLFEPSNPCAWRFHEDPLATRRPMAELEDKPATDSLVV